MGNNAERRISPTELAHERLTNRERLQRQVVGSIRNVSLSLLLVGGIGYGLYELSKATLPPESEPEPVVAALVCIPEYNPDIPFGNPLVDPNAPDFSRVVKTQGYTAGSHSPPEIWGAVDLATSDGITPNIVRATIRGVVDVTTTAQAPLYGNSVVIDGVGYETYDGHLEKPLVEDGQYVNPGDPIGIEGSTGAYSTGLHTHHEVRDKNRLNSGGSYLRVDPEQFGAVDGVIRTEQNSCSQAPYQPGRVETPPSWWQKLAHALSFEQSEPTSQDETGGIVVFDSDEPGAKDDLATRVENFGLPYELPKEIEGEITLGEISEVYDPPVGSIERDGGGINNVIGVLNWLNGARIEPNTHGTRLFADVLGITDAEPFRGTQSYKVLKPDGQLVNAEITFNNLGSPNIFLGAEGCFPFNNLMYALFGANTVDPSIRILNLHELEHTAPYGPWYYDPDGSRTERTNLVYAFYVPSQDPKIATDSELIIRGAYNPETGRVTVRVSKVR